MYSARRGFTLVEVLVTVSILAVLSLVGLTYFQGTQQKSRDVARKQHVNQLALALEAYYQKNGTYVTSGTNGSCATDTPIFYSEIDDFMVRNQVPTDPKTKYSYCYISLNGGQSYRLFAKLENCDDKDLIAGQCNNTYNFSRTSEDLPIAAAPAGSVAVPGPGGSPVPSSTAVSTPTAAPVGPTATPTSTPRPTPTPTPTTAPVPTPTPCNPSFIRVCPTATPAPTAAPTTPPVADSDGDGDPNSTDCGPNDNRAKHGQTQMFSTSYTNSGGLQSYDFDCDGVTTQSTSVACTCLALNNPNPWTYYQGAGRGCSLLNAAANASYCSTVSATVPACGQMVCGTNYTNISNNSSCTNRVEFYSGGVQSCR